MMNTLADRILAIVKSRRFYKFVIVFFVFEASWIALTAAYPQAFDEQFHFGLIKIYSHYYLPFLSKQPTGANEFGAVARDPSYLYHYLMSFPYRYIELITKRQSYQIVFLRFLDIAMLTYGIVLFRRIMIKIKLSEGLANLVVLIFTLIPIVPQLAGQINYDDMLFPMVALICLLSFEMIDQIKKNSLSFKTTISMITLATLASLVKYAFMPIALSIGVFFVFYILKYYKDKLPKIWNSFKADFKKTSLLVKTVLIGGLLISGGLFIQRDVVNLIDYHELEPECSSVMSLKACSQYGAWYANYSRHQTVITERLTPSHNIIVYAGEWTYWMWYRLFFAVSGPSSNFTNYPPLPLPSAVALIIGLVGLAAVIKYRRQLFRSNPYAVFILLACAFYTLALFAQGYSTYQFTAVLENMNGRYLLPILLLAGAIIAKAFSVALKKSGHLKVVVACVVVLLFLQGGGILTFISRSDSSWYWQNSKIIKANNVAKKITNKLVVKGRNTYSTSFWFFN